MGDVSALGHEQADLTIRPAETGDGAAITALLLPVFRAGDSYTVDPGISPDAALAYWTAPEKTVFVAQKGAAILGTYYIRPNQGGPGGHICNCGYITAPEARGQGVARAMLGHSLTEAKRQGYRAMQYNFVVANNTRAIETWARAGFETVGRIPKAFRHPEAGYVDALVMWKDLSAGA